MSGCLGGSGKCCSVISYQFLDALARKVVLHIEQFPPLLQVELGVPEPLYSNWFSRHWRVLTCTHLENFRGHGCKLSLEDEAVKAVFKTDRERPGLSKENASSEAHLRGLIWPGSRKDKGARLLKSSRFQHLCRFILGK